MYQSFNMLRDTWGGGGSIPALKKLEGHIAFGLSVCVCVCVCVRVYVC